MQYFLTQLVFGFVCVLFTSAHVLPNTRENTYFYLSNEKADWVTALNSCEKQGKRFAKILSTEDHDVMLGIITRKGRVGQTFWVGGTDFLSKGSIKWVSEPNEHFIPANFTNWMIDQPYANRYQGCLQILPIDYRWNILENCGQPNYYICEEDES